jgi:hypothetical protein
VQNLLRLAEWVDDPGNRPYGRRSAVSIAVFSVLLVPWALPLASIGPSLGVDVVASAVVAAILLCLLAVVISPLRGRPVLDRPALIVGTLLTLALFAGAAYSLRSPLAAGFPACTGGDAGQHVTLMYQHCRGLGADYPTLGFHSAAYLIQQALTIAPLYSFSALFHLVLLGLAEFAALATIVFAQQQGVTRGRELALVAVATGAGLWAVAHSIVLPLLNRYQCDGFMPQVFGLLALLLACSAYSLADGRLLRWTGLLLALVFFRLSYVLNAGDILLTYAILAVVEARGATGGVRRVLHLGALTFTGLAAAAYYSMYRISHLSGGFARFDLLPALGSLALLAGIPVIVFLSRGSSSEYTRGRRLQIISGSFCLLGAVVPTLWLLTTQSAPRYYLYKYPFAATILAPCVVLPWVVVSLFTWRRRRVGSPLPAAMPVVAALALAGLILGHGAYGGYRRALSQRSTAGSTTSLLVLHADPRIVDHIRRTLDREEARFGGFYTHRWPEESFTNAMLGRSYFEVDETRPGPQPGRCVFWDTVVEDHWSNEALTRAVERLQGSGDNICTTLDGRSEKEAPRRICYRCSPLDSGSR